MNENKKALYFSIILGTIGNILIAIATMKYLVKENDILGYGIILFGLVLTNLYISDLEKKAGIRKKLTLIRVFFVTLSLFISALYFFYY
ncbi:hypothetical protein BABA_13652 [Neobacillus bataviensis LMG 21833]|uniref:Uncharacterized protein n=1 Tax=Neobacillus bataviensis LMG 21833 TaxID=1117379 RepID=K6D355_9BACI|nr:hypothetical protein [Neobacillus bataviensis]EKN66937.1 hypothetical protein BABA_13652 [Neobacillus bataviensis LMG 21833]